MHARPAVAALALGGVLVVSTASVAAQTPTIPYPGYPPQPAYVADSCLFGAAINWHLPEQNVAGPDTAAISWYTRYQLPAHATITLHGDYPTAASCPTRPTRPSSVSPAWSTPR
jgi:hypothetical protein